MENIEGTLITKSGRIMDIEISNNFEILHLGDKIAKPITIFEQEEAEILEADIRDLEDIRFMSD